MNSKPLVSIALLLAISPVAVHADNPTVGNPDLPLLPRPVSVKSQAGEFRIDPLTTIVAPIALDSEAQTLATALRTATDLPIPVRKQAGSNAIRLSLDSKLDRLSPEGYRLQIGANRIELAALKKTGIFYGGRTLLQLIPVAVAKDHVTIAGVIIEDQPRFPWRGLMLDCSRTFQSMDYLKKTIDRMASYKLNVLHLHLTDDQGWRLEIKKYPALTSKGAFFASKYHEPASHQGFFTQAQMRDLVAYAAARHISIVPEIEMPGHSIALLSVMPELSCTGGPFEIYPFGKGPGITKEILCAGNEETFKMLGNVLDEVAAIFPSPFIHIGGDEAPKTAWKSCPKCQARMKAEGLKNEEELQSYFIRRMENHLAGKGRRLLGWDEILEGGLAPNATVMSWRSTNGGLAAARAGHDVVMTPNSHCYFDYDYRTINSERVFSFDPVAGLTPDAARHVLGVQANFWSHIDREPALVDRQLFPRLMALAERGWSPDNRDDWPAFARRANAQLPRLKSLGIHYQKSDLLQSKPTTP